MKLIAFLGGKCVSCGSIEKLEFDHIIRSTKTYTIASKTHWPIEKLLDELNKCQLLCIICHKKKTAIERKEFKPESKHGTISRYRHRKCRCDKCKEAWKQGQKKWKKAFNAKRRVLKLHAGS